MATAPVFLLAWQAAPALTAGKPGHGGGGAGAAYLILAGLVLAAVWAGSLYIHPFTRCGSCGGSGLNKGSTGKKFGTCKACGGSRRKQRFGSRTLHRWVQSARTEYQRERARRLERRVEERTRNPRETGDR
jgi:hypothetical protein